MRVWRCLSSGLIFGAAITLMFDHEAPPPADGFVMIRTAKPSGVQVVEDIGKDMRHTFDNHPVGEFCMIAKAYALVLNPDGQQVRVYSDASNELCYRILKNGKLKVIPNG